MDVGLSATAVCAGLAAPGVIVIVGAVVVTGWPSIVAVTVFVPAVVPVNTAVYVPSPLSVTVPNVPCAVPAPRPNVTVEPPTVTGLPLESLVVSVTVVVDPD